MPPFHRGVGNPGIPMPTHGLPPGMPHPDMLPPPPPPMMPPGFRGQFPPMPLPGMLALGLRPPMPPVGMLPWPANLPRGLAPPGLPGLPKPPMLPPDQIRTQQQNGREVLSLLPQPPPMPGAPPNIRGPPFPRPEGPGINLPGRPNFIPVPRNEPPFNIPTPLEIPRFPPPQVETRPPPIDFPRIRMEQPGLSPAPMWPPNNIDKKEDISPEKIPMKEFCHSTGGNMVDLQKEEKTDDKPPDRRDNQNLDQGRNRSPEKNKDERDRRNREDYREVERKEKKERTSNDNRRDDRNDRRDRDRDERRERDDRDERRDRDYRNDRNRKGRDDRNDRSDYRNRDERDNNRRVERGGREKYGKDEFGRDESIREDDRNRRDEINRDEDRNRREELGREEDKTRRRDRSPEKNRTRESDSNKEKARDTYKSDEVSSSSDKKEFPLDIKGQGLPGFKSTMQPISERNENKTSPQLPTVKSGFKSTMQPVSDGFKSTMQPATDSFKSTMQPAPEVKTNSTDEHKAVASTSNKSVSSTGKKNKGKAFIPFSIFPFPMHSEEDDEDNVKEDERDNLSKEEAGSSGNVFQKNMGGEDASVNTRMCAEGIDFYVLYLCRCSLVIMG